MEAPSVLDALLPWGAKAAEMVDAVFRPVAEQATQVVDVRLSEAPVPSRLAAADRVEKLKFVVPRYVLAVAQLAYEDATAALADVWTPEAQEKAQRASLADLDAQRLDDQFLIQLPLWNAILGHHEIAARCTEMRGRQKLHDRAKVGGSGLA